MNLYQSGCNSLAACCSELPIPKAVLIELQPYPKNKQKGGETVAVSACMTRPTAHIYAVQHIRKMRGGAQAHLLRASDNHYYVTKFQNNPQATRILANEYLASKLGTLLGLPMPEVQIIEVSEWLIQSTPDLKIDLGGGMTAPCATGLQLGSRYVADPFETTVFDYLPEAMMYRLANLEDFPRVLAFDKWTGNSDGRQAVFVKQPNERRYHAIFIDQGYCFNAGEWNFADLALRGLFPHNTVYESVAGWQSFEPTLSLIEQIDLNFIWEIAREIPQEWCMPDPGALPHLIESLHHRRFLVHNLITSFRNSTRSPFPNWAAEHSPSVNSKPTPKEE